MMHSEFRSFRREELYRGKKPPEDGCMEPKHVVEEEQEI
jgi:hypothetical protein